MSRGKMLILRGNSADPGTYPDEREYQCCVAGRALHVRAAKEYARRKGFSFGNRCKAPSAFYPPPKGGGVTAQSQILRAPVLSSLQRGRSRLSDGLAALGLLLSPQQAVVDPTLFEIVVAESNRSQKA